MVRARLPEGTIVNPRRPAPVSCRAAAIKRIAEVLVGAMVQALPERIPAASNGINLVIAFGGVDPANGRQYITAELGAGGMGARPGKEGIDSIETDATNAMNIPVEPLEMGAPLMVTAHHLWPDSGGAGKFRGGLGVEKVFTVRRGEALVSYRGERFYTTPWGLFGGLDGRSSIAIHRSPSGDRVLPSKQVFTLRAGEELRSYCGGGGGWGDPLERDPALVLDDVLDERVSVETARDRYGVVLDASGRAVDAAATADRRRQMAGQRTFPEWPYYRNVG